MIAILDYGAGNNTSICNALDFLDAKSKITGSPKEILNSSHLIVPGVGAFSHAIKSLRKSGLDQAILSFVKTGKPILGICLGYQLFQLKSFEHGENEGLALLPGVVERLNVGKPIPHIGWSQLEINDSQSKHPFLNGVCNHSFYFVHSYCVQYEHDYDKYGTTEYGGEKFASITLDDNIMGVQFHPEKSSVAGLNLLNNFLKM